MYERDGYVVVPGVLDAERLAEARAEATAICRGERGTVDGVEPGDWPEDEVLRRYLCVHFPHKISPLLRKLAALPGLTEVLTEVIGPNVKMMQSMLFIKAAGKPGQAWHQDEAHIPTRDRSLTAAWIALDDATVDNGCLWVLPGSHRAGVLYPVRDHDDPRFDCTQEAHGFTEAFPDLAAVPVEVPAGTAVIFNGYLLHRSLPNTRRTGLRRALVNHYMSAESLLPWFPPTAGEPMARLDHRDVELVAGTDPYAHAGTADLMRPHIRRDREGGCVG
ncbi:phytanoyl-CoA dioxygenase family protein [Actinophytocola sp.]|uniref:phytanoyl-CoA dioxygenase family protein n=1 Tax=Actinophytocola sp. TaxID=1872138 RepID=UPI003D6A06B3